jgi:uncharacterized membrane protein YccC
MAAQTAAALATYAVVRATGMAEGTWAVISALFVVQQRKLWEAPAATTGAHGSRRVLGGLELVMAALAERLGAVLAEAAAAATGAASR